MKRPAKIVMGKLHTEALKDPRVARLHSKEFREELLEGMREAKAAALAQEPAKPAASARKHAAA